MAKQGSVNRKHSKKDGKCPICGLDINHFIQEIGEDLHVDEYKDDYIKFKIHSMHKFIKAIVEDSREQEVTSTHKRLFLKAVKKIYKLIQTDRE
jgi:hypothetical protein